MIFRLVTFFFFFLLAGFGEAFAVPASQTTLYCTGGTAFEFNDMYFTLTPDKTTEIDIHNAYSDRLNLHVTANTKTHYWLKGRYDATGTGYVTIDSVDTGVNFGASALYCMSPQDRESITNAGYYNPGEAGGQAIEDILVMYNTALSMVSLFFFCVLIWKRE